MLRTTQGLPDRVRLATFVRCTSPDDGTWLGGAGLQGQHLGEGSEP